MGGAAVTPYSISYSFAGWQAINPDRPLPAMALDGELADIQASLESVIAAVAQVRRSDGRVANGSVTFDSLDPQLAAVIGGTNDITAMDLNPTAFALQAEAEAGVSNDKIMTPLRVTQTLDAQRAFASQAQAEAASGTPAAVMSPARVRESIAARRPFASEAQAQGGTHETSVLSPQRGRDLLNALRTANTATSNLTYGEIAAGASAAQTITVAGAVVGDGVVIGLPAAGLPAGLVASAWVSSAGNVTLRITNTTGAAVTPPGPAAYRVTAIRF